MGGGGSVNKQQVDPVGPKVAPSADVLEDSLSRMREDIRWMQKAVEAEKAEKEWLMQRYERMEKESVDRAREVAQLRQQLADLTLAQAKAQSTQDAPLPVAAKPLQLAAPVPAALSVSTTPDSPPTSTRGSLRDRRGLALGVVTAKPVDDVAPKEEAPLTTQANIALAPSEVPVESRKNLFLQSLNSDPTRLLEPMTDKSYRSRTWGMRCTEPVSPLLSRRMEWDVGPKSIRSQGLNVQAAKLLDMGELVPASPKFAKKRTQNWSSAIEPIAEG